jgi:hypothetical protein
MKFVIRLFPFCLWADPAAQLGFAPKRGGTQADLLQIEVTALRASLWTSGTIDGRHGTASTALETLHCRHGRSTAGTVDAPGPIFGCGCSRHDQLQGPVNSRHGRSTAGTIDGRQARSTAGTARQAGRQAGRHGRRQARHCKHGTRDTALQARHCRQAGAAQAGAVDGRHGTALQARHGRHGRHCRHGTALHCRHGRQVRHGRPSR